MGFIAKATETHSFSDPVRELTSQFASEGIAAFDAFHLAFASVAKVDYFCTSDDKLLRRAKKLAGLSVELITPLRLIEIVGQGETMILENKSLANISQTARRALLRELGPINTVRFLNQFRMGSGDYTVEREQWLAGYTVEQIAQELQQKDRGPTEAK